MDPFLYSDDGPNPPKKPRSFTTCPDARLIVKDYGKFMECEFSGYHTHAKSEPDDKLRPVATLNEIDCYLSCGCDGSSIAYLLREKFKDKTGAALSPYQFPTFWDVENREADIQTQHRLVNDYSHEEKMIHAKRFLKKIKGWRRVPGYVSQLLKDESDGSTILVFSTDLQLQFLAENGGLPVCPKVEVLF
jgi:hypothetical protein